LGQPAVNVSGALAKYSALSKLGETITNLAFERQRKIDATVVNNAYLEYDDAARKTLQTLLQQKGEDAIGLQQKYDKWHSDFGKEYIPNRFSTGNQELLFKDQIASKRSRNLDILARYENQETQRWQEQTQRNMFTIAVQDMLPNPYGMSIVDGEEVLTANVIWDEYIANLKKQKGELNESEVAEEKRKRGCGGKSQI
jgi:hypothetical protein